MTPFRTGDPVIVLPGRAPGVVVHPEPSEDHVLVLLTTGARTVPREHVLLDPTPTDDRRTA